MVRGLEIFHHAAVTTDGCLIQALALIEAPHAHFLAGQMVSAQVNF